jgi:hypothetical protein
VDGVDQILDQSQRASNWTLRAKQRVVGCKNDSKKCELLALFIIGFQAYMDIENCQKFQKIALQAALKAWRQPFRMFEKPFFRFLGLISDIKSTNFSFK